jgi:hypothetical protein
MVEIIVPYADGCPHRARALAYVLDHYKREHPDWRVTVAPPVCHTSPPGDSASRTWCKAQAVMPAVEASSAEVVVVADADVFCHGLADAVAAVHDRAAWAIPHDAVHRLSEEGAAAVLAGADPKGQPLAERAYRGIEGGGIVVARRETWLACPVDPRFVGWGREDCSLGMALHTVHGPSWRGNAPLWHLWHPPQQRVGRKRGTPATEALFRRYIKARRSADEMRSLLQEARDALQAAQPHGHDHAPLGVH